MECRRKQGSRGSSFLWLLALLVLQCGWNCNIQCYASTTTDAYTTTTSTCTTTADICATTTDICATTTDICATTTDVSTTTTDPSTTTTEPSTTTTNPCKTTTDPCTTTTDPFTTTTETSSTTSKRKKKMKTTTEACDSEEDEEEKVSCRTKAKTTEDPLDAKTGYEATDATVKKCSTTPVKGDAAGSSKDSTGGTAATFPGNGGTQAVTAPEAVTPATASTAPTAPTAGAPPPAMFVDPMSHLRMGPQIISQPVVFVPVYPFPMTYAPVQMRQTTMRIRRPSGFAKKIQQRFYIHGREQPTVMFAARPVGFHNPHHAMPVLRAHP